MSVLLRTFLTLLVFSRAPAFASTEPVTQNQQDKKQAQSQVSPTLFKHSLSGLYGISSFTSQPTQPYSDFNELYSKAADAQNELETICSTTAMLTDSSTVFAGIKSEARARQKIATDLDNDSRRITDLARATIISDDISSLVSTYELLEKQARIVSVKNRFKHPAPSGYRDLNILVQLPKSGIIAEIQLHLTDIANVKSGPEHDIYEKIQKIERTALAENREISEFENNQITGLRAESLRLYHEAWHPYITTNLKAA